MNGALSWRRMRMTPRVMAVAAIALIVGLVVVLASGEDSSRPSGQNARIYRDAHAGLCEALAAARAGELDRAHGVFVERAHFPLHQLTAEITSRNRTVAARLLEAKATVEASLPSGSSTAADDLSRLASTTAAAISVTGSDRPASCG